MAVTFEVSDYQQAKINVWFKSKLADLLEKQKAVCGPCKRATKKGACWKHMFGPYLGAIGGGPSYKFTDTSIGCMLSVEFMGESLFVPDELDDCQR